LPDAEFTTTSTAWGGVRAPAVRFSAARARVSAVAATTAHAPQPAIGAAAAISSVGPAAAAAMAAARMSRGGAQPA